MRVERIELSSTAWKAVILPLNHTRDFRRQQLFRRLFHYIKHSFKIVTLRHLIASLKAATFTNMHDGVFGDITLRVGTTFDAHRLHKATAFVDHFPIARMNINVLAPQTRGAMICKTVPFHGQATFAALKIFAGFLEHKIVY